MFGWLRRMPKLVECIEVKPTDAFFISTDRMLHPQQREAIAQAVDRFRNGELKVLVLEKGFRVTVIRMPPQ